MTPATSVAAPLAATTTYAADSSTFPNPERGFHNRYDIVPGGNTDFSRCLDETFKKFRYPPYGGEMQHTALKFEIAE